MKKKNRRIILISILSLLMLLGAAFVVYTQDYYRSDKSVETLIELNDNIEINNSSFAGKLDDILT